MSRRGNPFPGVTRAPDRHGKVRWRLRLTIKGRRIDTYINHRYNSADFRAAYEEAINPPEAAPKSAGALGTFDQVISHYRGSKRFAELARSTRYAKGKRLDQISRFIGPFRLGSLQPHHVENLMDRKGGPDAANRLLKEIHELYEHARRRMGLAAADPTIGVERRKTRQGGYHTWTEAEVERYRTRHPSGTKARLALEALLATGASRQDACALGRHSIKGQDLYYRRGKTGQDATLPLRFMSAFVAEILQLPPGTTLFITHTGGRPYTKESFGNWFKEQCVAAGLPNCTAHGLRKRGATMLAEAGANEFHIMAFLAHATTRQAATYVREANRRKLAADGLAMIHAANVSNLSGWLDKTTDQDIERKR